MLLEVKRLLIHGVHLAMDDYCRIAERPLGVDVKPKEDQLKCALYRAFSEAGKLVCVETGYERAGGKCDLVVAMRRPVGLELKTAWASTGWKNKPAEQAKSWNRDLERLATLADKGFGAGFLVLMFAYEAGSKPEAVLRAKTNDLGKPSLHTEPRKLTLWNGLDRLECMAWRAF